MKIRVAIAIIVCKLTRFALRRLGKGGTALPGKVALGICPDLLTHLARDMRCVAVTGTNGKTTSSRIIEKMFEDSGKSYFANRSGANLMTGITAEFAVNAAISGKPRKEWAVIECDEAAARKVFPALSPDVILVTNLFRDQLDRFGEVTHALSGIRDGILGVPGAKVCLNADCSLTSSIASDIPNDIVFFGVETILSRGGTAELSDAPHCIRCKAEYEYDYVTYAHLGGFRCPRCGYQRRSPQVKASKVLETDSDSTTVTIEAFGEAQDVRVNLPGGYNVYNAVGAVAAGKAAGFSLKLCLDAASDFECGFGRMEKFDLGGLSARMILIKNPAGCNQALSFIASLDSEPLIVICLNDRIADGTDISWIWDADFEKLLAMDERLPEIIVSGVRAEDMALRLKYAGLAKEKLRVVKDYGELIGEMTSQGNPVYIMPTYTAMLDLRDRISKEFGCGDFWE